MTKTISRSEVKKETNKERQARLSALISSASVSFSMPRKQILEQCKITKTEWYDFCRGHRYNGYRFRMKQSKVDAISELLGEKLYNVD